MYLFTRFGLGRALLAVAVAAVAFTSCAEFVTEGGAAPQQTPAAKTWMPLSSCSDGGWASVPISDRVDYNLLYEDIVSRISRGYEIDMISKESGYIRTKWKNTVSSNGQEVKNERTKVTIKLSPQRSKIEINAEAEKMADSGDWLKGCNEQALENLKEDLRGLSGY